MQVLVAADAGSLSAQAHGIYFQGRMEDARQCMLVLIGATPEGKKELAK